MKILYALLSVLFISFICLTKSMAQFTGGNASGYASAFSTIQQLNPPLFNDLQIVDFTQPIDNQTLNINTNYNLGITIKNSGSYPVFPNDSIFFTVTLNADLLVDSFFFLAPDTLQTGFSTNKTFSNILNFSDSVAAAQLCITLNGTSFASDSVISNNSHCNIINIIDPSGIDSYEHNNGFIFYNPENKYIIFKNIAEIQKIYIYDVMGKEIPFIFFTENDTKVAKLNVSYPKIIFVKVFLKEKVFSKKLILF